MSTEENKAVVRRFHEEDQKRNLDGIVKLCAPHYVWHGTGVLPDSDLAGFKQALTAFWTAFPDVHLTIEDLIAEGDKVVARATMRGPHRGAFMGIAPTGKHVTLTGIAIFRVEEGKIADVWQNGDMLGLMQQLGAIPQMAQTGT